MVSDHTNHRCAKRAYWHSLNPSTLKCRTTMNKLDAISHLAKHMNNKSLWQQFCSICSLNVPSFQTHGQVKTQRSKQMDSLCGTQSCHICWGVEEASCHKVNQILKWEYFMGQAPEWLASVKPSVQNSQTHSSLKEVVAPSNKHSLHILSCRE